MRHGSNPWIDSTPSKSLAGVSGALLLWWGGVRGALSVALALAASEHLAAGSRVPAIAYGIVAVSLLLQGTVVRPAVRLLRLGSD